MRAIIRILLVCSGNTCRSPMSEALLRRELESRARERMSFEVRSAGVHAFEGDPASPHAVRVMSDLGLDISGHKATRITQQLIRDSDLILTMTRGHKNEVLALAPEGQGKVFTVGEFIGKGEDYEIADPFGGELEDYRRSAADIHEAVRMIADKIMERIEREQGQTKRGEE